MAADRDFCRSAVGCFGKISRKVLLENIYWKKQRWPTFLYLFRVSRARREREKRMDGNKSLESKLDQLDGVRTRAINFLDQLSNLETLVKKLSFFLPE